MLKKASKVLFITILSCCLSFESKSQTILLEAMNGFNELTEAMDKFFSNASIIDNSINKDKAQKMATTLYGNVADIISAKDSIIIVLEADTSINVNYEALTKKLGSKMDELTTTLKKYDALVMASGTNTIDLSHKLRHDFLVKSSKLNRLKTLLNTESDQKARAMFIYYLKSCMNILKNTQHTLAKYKA